MEIKYHCFLSTKEFNLKLIEKDVICPFGICVTFFILFTSITWFKLYNSVNFSFVMSSSSSYQLKERYNSLLSKLISTCFKSQSITQCVPHRTSIAHLEIISSLTKTYCLLSIILSAYV